MHQVSARLSDDEYFKLKELRKKYFTESTPKLIINAIETAYAQMLKEKEEIKPINNPLDIYRG